MIIKRKLYSGKGTQAIYKVLSPFYKNKQSAKRAAITVKQPLEKAGHNIADRWAIAGAIAGPAVPIPGVSWALGGAYAVSPKVVKAIPGVGKVIGRVEQTPIVKKAAKPVHKFVDWLFKAGGKK